MTSFSTAPFTSQSQLSQQADDDGYFTVGGVTGDATSTDDANDQATSDGDQRVKTPPPQTLEDMYARLRSGGEMSYRTSYTEEDDDHHAEIAYGRFDGKSGSSLSGSNRNSSVGVEIKSEEKAVVDEPVESVEVFEAEVKIAEHIESSRAEIEKPADIQQPIEVEKPIEVQKPVEIQNPTIVTEIQKPTYSSSQNGTSKYDTSYQVVKQEVEVVEETISPATVKAEAPKPKQDPLALKFAALNRTKKPETTTTTTTLVMGGSEVTPEKSKQAIDETPSEPTFKRSSSFVSSVQLQPTSVSSPSPTKAEPPALNRDESSNQKFPATNSEPIKTTIKASTPVKPSVPETVAVVAETVVTETKIEPQQRVALHDQSPKFEKDEERRKVAVSVTLAKDVRRMGDVTLAKDVRKMDDVALARDVRRMDDVNNAKDVELDAATSYQSEPVDEEPVWHISDDGTVQKMPVDDKQQKMPVGDQHRVSVAGNVQNVKITLAKEEVMVTSETKRSNMDVKPELANDEPVWLISDDGTVQKMPVAGNPQKEPVDAGNLLQTPVDEHAAETASCGGVSVGDHDMSCDSLDDADHDVATTMTSYIDVVSEATPSDDQMSPSRPFGHLKAMFATKDAKPPPLPAVSTGPCPMLGTSASLMTFGFMGTSQKNPGVLKNRDVSDLFTAHANV